MNNRGYFLALQVFLGTLLLGGCQAMETRPSHPAPGHQQAATSDLADEGEEKASPGFKGFVVDLRNLPDLSAIMPDLSEKRVVFVGEAHTRYGHHLSQLEIIRRLYEIDPDIAVGMEFFQQSFQRDLDAFVAGSLNEKEMLRKTEYYNRWIYDYRLYRPILDFAREKGIPLIALNIPKEIIKKAAKGGIDALTADERAQIPADIDESDETYRKRIEEIYRQHPSSDSPDFEHFLKAQLLWDEGMAERAFRYLEANPEKRMVVLAGIGHVIGGTGIPNRVTRRLPVETAIVLPGDSLEVAPGIGDFLIYPEQVKLPPIGKMGVILANQSEGVRIMGVVPGSPAAKGGISQDDRILTLEGEPMNSVADIKIALLDKKPGDEIRLTLRRRVLFWEKEIEQALVLGN